jgi:biofilm PGA synthesis N-glycosyltransferase PgaC
MKTAGTGAKGQLGSHSDIELPSPDSIATRLKEVRPQVVASMAAMHPVENSQRDEHNMVATPASTQSSRKIHRIGSCGYVLLTAAYNEEANIEKTVHCVLSQTLLPSRWVIISDGSIDRTDEIVQPYIKDHGFIRFLRVMRTPGRSFGSKVRALREGGKLIEGIPFSFIGNLDADVSVGPSYFESLIARFEMRPSLGLAGGFVYEETDGEFRSRRSNRVYSVAHAGQLVRRDCYEAIGGYAVLEHGGEDWHAQTSARMRGWEAEAFPELQILHHRHTGEADNLLRHKFRQGRLDYSFGSAPLFEILKCLERVPEKPILRGSMARLAGFLWSGICRDRRPVSDEFMTFLRREQKEKILALLKGRPSHPMQFSP